MLATTHQVSLYLNTFQVSQKRALPQTQIALNLKDILKILVYRDQKMRPIRNS